jgi:hypothetical protein
MIYRLKNDPDPDETEIAIIWQSDKISIFPQNLLDKVEWVSRYDVGYLIRR